MSFWRLHYHLVWTTWKRAPLLVGDNKSKAYGAILGKAKDLGVLVHAIGGTEDHAHMLVTLPTTIAVAKALQVVKAGSSEWISRTFPRRRDFQ